MTKNEIRTSDYFDNWLAGLKDETAVKHVKARLRNAESGNFGRGRRNIAEGVSEMKIDYGPGYRLYYCQRGGTVYLLLMGGDKSTQGDDIRRAVAIKKEAETEGKW